MVVSIKMNFLQKAIIPSLFLPCTRLLALLGGLRHGEPSVILSVLGRDVPWTAGIRLSRQPACLSTQEGKDGVGPLEEKELHIRLILPSASCWGSRQVPRKERRKQEQEKN